MKYTSVRLFALAAAILGMDICPSYGQVAPSDPPKESVSQPKKDEQPGEPKGAEKLDGPAGKKALADSKIRDGFLNAPISITVGAARSTGAEGGPRLAAKVGDELGIGRGIFQAGRTEPTDTRSWFLSLMPVVDVETTESNGFNHVVMKITGALMSFPLTAPEFAGDSPDPSGSGMWHVVPISAGFEADDQFRFTNALAEIGYAPWYRTGTYPPKPGKFELGFNPYVGAFLQGGRKIEIDDTTRTGAAADKSAEQSDTSLLRVKLRARMEIPLIQSEEKNTALLTLSPEGTLWYDFVNGDWYHQLRVVADLKIRDNQSIEFRYDNGSGAPHFNTGSQFGAGLKIAF